MYYASSSSFASLYFLFPALLFPLWFQLAMSQLISYILGDGPAQVRSKNKNNIMKILIIFVLRIQPNRRCMMQHAQGSWKRWSVFWRQTEIQTRRTQRDGLVCCAGEEAIHWSLHANIMTKTETLCVHTYMAYMRTYIHTLCYACTNIQPGIT